MKILMRGSKEVEIAFCSHLPAHTFQKLKCKDFSKEIRIHPSCTTMFGAGGDLYIYDDCNLNNSNYSNLGSSYEAPNGHLFGSNEAKNYLAGSYTFTVQEIEVFKLI